MGKAVILMDSDFSGYGLGVVTLKTRSIIPEVARITEATIFKVMEEGVQLTSVMWSISDSTLASLVDNLDGTCTITPLTITSTPVQLTANFLGGTLTTSFIASIPAPELVWYIDRCTINPQEGSIKDGNPANGGWAYMPQDNALLQGQKINRIKVVPQIAGVFNIYKGASLSATPTLVGSFTIQAADLGTPTTYEIQEFTLGAAEWLILGERNSAGCFKYHGVSPNTGLNGAYSKVPWGTTPSSPVTPGAGNIDLNASIGYYGYLD